MRVRWQPLPSRTTEASPQIVRVLRRLTLVASGTVLLIATGALIGWVNDVAWLKDPVHGFTPMKPDTVVMLIFTALALGASVGAHSRRRTAGTVLAGIGAALAMTVLAQDVLGRDFGVDSLIIHLPHLRPAVPTSLGILLLDLAILLLDVHPGDGPTPSEVLATIAGALASLTLGGCVYGAVQFYVWGPPPHASGMAINTSVSLLALAVGTLAARPRTGVMATFSSSHVGGQVLRRMLLLALLIPLVGFFSIQAQQAGLYKPPGGAVVEGVSSMIVAAIIAIAVARSLDRTDAQRRRVEAESREWKRFFDRAAFGAGFGTPDGRIGLVNEAFARMHGYTVAELEGRPISDLFPPDARPELAAKLQLTHELGSLVWKTEHLRKDGSTFPVVIDVSAVRAESGELLYRAAYVQDITAERAADAVRSRLASLVQSAEDAIMAQSLDGTLLDWNQGAERLFGYKAEEVVGCSMDQLVPESRRAERTTLVTRALAGETIAGFETEQVGKDGGTFPVALTLSPIRDEVGRVVGLSSISRDISALKQLEREREEWSSLVAHDLRQPAATIRLTANVIARQGAGPTTQSAVDRICGASDRLERMIGDLLDVSRIEARRLEVRPRVRHLVPLIREVVEATPACSRRCRVKVADDPDTASVDGERFMQVLSNLLSNAVKYGYPGTPIEVSLSRREETVEISVTNEGPGIAPNEISGLFSRFARTRTAERSDTPGLGLGLHISQGIVEAHGGRLWVESQPGERTHFRFTLPRAMPGGRAEDLTAPPAVH
jgi:PAS domain S-box-containing protein